MNAMKMLVNNYEMEWKDGHRATPSHIGSQCLREPTSGLAVFYSDQRQIDSKRCCLSCALTECMRLGLKGTIAVKEIFDGGRVQ